MMRTIKQAVCDRCKKSLIVYDHYEPKVERILKKLGWSFPRLSPLGGIGHYCPNEACQRAAKLVECQQ